MTKYCLQKNLYLNVGLLALDSLDEEGLAFILCVLGAATDAATSSSLVIQKNRFKRQENRFCIDSA